MRSATAVRRQMRKRSQCRMPSCMPGHVLLAPRRRPGSTRSNATIDGGYGSPRSCCWASNRGCAVARNARRAEASKARRRPVSPDERSFSASIDAVLQRVRMLSIVDAAIWGVAVAAISPVAGALAAIAIAAVRAHRSSRIAIVRVLDRASPDARNLFVTADELSRGRLAAVDHVRQRVFADASARVGAVDLRRVFPATALLMSAACAVVAWTIVMAVGRFGPPRAAPGSSGIASQSRSPNGLRAMTIRVTLHPPSYTGMPDTQVVDPAELRCVEGSVAVLSIDAGASRVTVEQDGAIRTLTAASGGRFVDRLPLTKTGYVVVSSDAGDRRTMPIVVAPDALPT